MIHGTRGYLFIIFLMVAFDFGKAWNMASPIEGGESSLRGVSIYFDTEANLWFDVPWWVIFWWV